MGPAPLLLTVKGGRCEAARATACCRSRCIFCRGLRACDVCKASAKPRNARVLFKGKSIADVLHMDGRGGG